MADSKTKYNYFKGISHFTQTNKTNAYGAYSVCIELNDPAELEKYKASGIQVEVSPENKVWFRRPHQKLFGNELQELGPPEVIDKNNQPVTDMIGTGSDIVVKVRSYPTIKGVGHTLDAIQVLNLIKVEGQNREYNF